MAAVEMMPDWQCRLLSPEEIQYLIGRLANLGMSFPREEIHSLLWENSGSSLHPEFSRHIQDLILGFGYNRFFVEGFCVF